MTGIVEICPKPIGDERGWFCEQWNQRRYKEMGIDANFVQDNESFSNKGVLRGLHWQAGEYAQAKLVRVIQGSVFDVVVDVRKDSPTFGQHQTFLLSGLNKRQVFIPRGFAHGFLVLEDNTLFSYKCDNLYHQPSERGLLYNDPELHI